MTARTETPFGPWEPAEPAEVAALFAPAAAARRAPWWIAGGHAVEHAVGRAFRAHADVDVLLLRRDQHLAQEALPDWEWWAADPPGSLRPWARGEFLAPGVHDVWCRPGAGEPWRIQLMLDEAEGDEWVSRRCEQVRRPIASLTAPRGRDGVPYLAPEVQLFYKAKSPRPKDTQDFEETRPYLTPHQRAWLHESLTHAYGPTRWHEALR
ncbi:amino acid transporter [Streptomyces sp. NPDC020412]|uniref:amino acid transporter n=1 Tax=Streptomyces sp. NPDC020412 TaxID=3365073 RepID=UPI00378898F0